MPSPRPSKPRIALMIALACAAAAMVPFWGNASTPVVVASLVAWVCLLVAIYKVR